MAHPPRELTPYASTRHYFGAELRRLRELAGLSAASLGKVTHYSGDLIARVEKAERWPKPDFVRACDEALKTGGSLGRLFPLVQAERQRLDGSAESGAMDRRELLGHARALGVAAALPGGLAGSLASGTLVSAFRSALMSTAGHPADMAGSGPAPRLSVVASQVADAWRARQLSRYHALAQMLGDVLTDAHRLAVEAPDRDRQRAESLLSFAYQCTAAALAKTGEGQLAWLAAERGVAAATRSEDPATVAHGTRMLAHAVMALGNHRQAERLAQLACAAVEHQLPTGDPLVLSGYGASLLSAAVAAAQQEKASTARQYLDEAAAFAAEVGEGHNYGWTAFGPSNAAIHRLSVEVALGEGGKGLEQQGQIDLDAIPSVERRAHHFIDQALANAQAGHHEEAGELLLDAHTLAPEEVRYLPSARQLVRQLARRGAGPTHAVFGELLRDEPPE